MFRNALDVCSNCLFYTTTSINLFKLSLKLHFSFKHIHTQNTDWQCECVQRSMYSRSIVNATFICSVNSFICYIGDDWAHVEWKWSTQEKRVESAAERVALCRWNCTRRIRNCKWVTNVINELRAVGGCSIPTFAYIRVQCSNNESECTQPYAAYTHTWINVC